MDFYRTGVSGLHTQAPFFEAAVVKHTRFRVICKQKRAFLCCKNGTHTHTVYIVVDISPNSTSTNPNAKTIIVEKSSLLYLAFFFHNTGDFQPLISSDLLSTSPSFLPALRLVSHIQESSVFSDTRQRYRAMCQAGTPPGLHLHSSPRWTGSAAEQRQRRGELERTI